VDGQNYLKKLKTNKRNAGLEKIPKNIVFFLGDGMGMSSITAARIMKAQRMSAGLEDVVLNFEEFPDVSLVKLSEFSYYLVPKEIISYEPVTFFSSDYNHVIELDF